MWFEGIFDPIGVLLWYFGTIWKVDILWPGTDFLWLGAGRTARPAGWTAQAGRPLCGRPAAGQARRPPACRRMRPCVCVRPQAAVCGLGVHVCAEEGGGVPPPPP